MKYETQIDLYAYFGKERPAEGIAGYMTAYALEQYPEFASRRRRPAMIIFPGGGYHFCSQRESQPIAMAYLANGFQTFVVDYSTGNRAGAAACYPVMQREAAMAIAYVRENAEKYGVLPDKIAVIGFSAGGHLAGSICTMFDDPVITDYMSDKAELCAPNAGVLSYAVLTFDGATHRGTRDQLTQGDDSLWPTLSIEKRVKENTPPLYLWANANDPAVPPTNTLGVAAELLKRKIPCEVHVFQTGGHGISLANAETAYPSAPQLNLPYVQVWLKESVEFLARNGFVPEG